MNKLAFGLTMMIVGIGGTFLTLTILIWSIELLKKLFPLEPAPVQPAWQFLFLQRIPPQWREKIPLDTIRYQWNQRLAPLQRASATWMQNLPVERLRAEWRQRLPIERLQYHWNQTLRLQQITSQENRRALLSSVQTRLFGRAAMPPPAANAPTDEHRDQTRPS